MKETREENRRSRDQEKMKLNCLINCPPSGKATETMTESVESRLNSSGTFSQDSPLCSSMVKSQSKLGETPETFTGRILFMSMFNDISCDKKDNEEECLANAKVVSIFAKKFGIGQWSFIGPGSERKWYSMEENSPQGIWDHIAERMLVEFAESGCPIFRATTPCPGVSSRAKDTENCRFTIVPTWQRLRLFFA